MNPESYAGMRARELREYEPRNISSFLQIPLFRGFCKKLIRILLSILFILNTGGCATPTPYQPRNSNGGYTDRRYAHDIFGIEFYGNHSTPNVTAYDYAMLRACEVTLQNGFNYFCVTWSTDAGEKTQLQPVTTSFTTGSVGPYGAISATTRSVTRQGEVFRPGTAIQIRCFKYLPRQSAGVGALMNAQSFQKELRTEYQIRK
jgi:hypothetical protein